MFILDAMLKRLVKKGALTVVDPEGRVHTYGSGQGFTSTLRIKDNATAWNWKSARPSWTAG
jgi:cyclopropane-fatty-acyl-phospholipid synthase